MGGRAMIGERGEVAGCTRAGGGECADKGGQGECPALDALQMREGEPGHLEASVAALLGCRSFLWDILMGGGWTGCARPALRQLNALYGKEAVVKAFEG